MQVIDKYYQKAFRNPECPLLSPNGTQINLESLWFSANGGKIIPEQTVESQMSELNKQDKKIRVLVYLLDEDNQEQVFVKSKDIICPKCYEPCRFQIENYKIKLYDCINNHITDNINIIDFPNTQKINESNIICGICKDKNKGKSYNHEFFKCLTCFNNLCPLCRRNHDSNHNIINYEDKNYICQKHNDFFIKYCTNCKLNLCLHCQQEHSDHNTIFFGDLLPNMDKLKEQSSEIKALRDKIKKIMTQLNQLDKTMDIYNTFQDNILKNYNSNKRNYNMLQNIKEISLNDEIFEKIKDINKTKELRNNIFNIIDLSNMININVENMEEEKENLIQDENFKEFKDKSHLNNIIKSDKKEEEKPLKDIMDKMTIIYKIEKNQQKIKIFGDNFVENNKNNCYIVIDGKQKELCSELMLNENQKESNTLEIKLI